MFENLGHYLPPLNFWDRGDLQFEEWQKDIIHKIKSNESVVLRAPTSSGKTFIAMATGIIHKKIYMFVRQNRWHIRLVLIILKWVIKFIFW